MGTSELAEYLEMQDGPHFVTKTELRQALRQRGQTISDRNLTYYSSVGLIPPAIRIGGRVGAYPELVVEQLAWVIRARNRGQSIESIKELLPLWRWLMRNRHDRRIDLSELELVARQHELSQEANFAVPYLISEVLLCLCPNCLQAIEWVLKDGNSFHHSPEDPLALSFILGAVNEETGTPEIAAWTQLALPGLGLLDPNGPTSITLGLPVGAHLNHSNVPWGSGQEPCGDSPRSSRSSQKEVLPLG